MGSDPANMKKVKNYGLSKWNMDSLHYSKKMSSIKHHFQSSPGSYDFMIGCPVSTKCFVPCLLGEELQQPTWPHVKHNRRWTQSEPIFSHSSHPFVLP